MTVDQMLTELLESEKEIAKQHARQARLIAAIADDPCAGVPAPMVEKEFIKEELRAALGESAEWVNTRISTARALVHRLPSTLVALENGEVTMRHVHVLTESITVLSDAEVARVEERCLVFARGHHDYTAFRRKVRREVLALDNATIAAMQAEALADRRVWTRPNDDSVTATFGAVLPADGARQLQNALDVAAERPAGPDDTRTKMQRRADALVQLATDALNRFAGCANCRDIVASDDNSESDETQPGGLPRWHGARPSIQVSVALSTLQGLDEQPADLAGHGPIPASLARRIAADQSGTWRRLVTDPMGRLLDYGRTRYRPPADLRDFVDARDRECQFPTCHVPAYRCEQDHIVAWADGGTTSQANLQDGCGRDHHTKHEAGWHVERQTDGSLKWTSPLGRTYVVTPEPYPIDHTPDFVVPDDNHGQAA